MRAGRWSRRARRHLTIVCALLAVAAAQGVLLNSHGSWALWTTTSALPGNTLSTITVTAVIANAPTSQPAGVISLSWSASTTPHAVTYSLWRRPSGIGGYAMVASGIAGTSTTDTPAADGSYDYEVQTDINNFVSPFSNVVIGLSDRISPNVTVACNPAPCAGWHRTSVNVTLTATDGGSGVRSISRRIDGGALTVVNAATTTFAVSGDANHTVSYFGTDNAGNAGAPSNQAISIDGTGPTVTYAICDIDGRVLPAAGNWVTSSGKFVVYAQVTDALSGPSTAIASYGPTGMGPLASNLTMTLGVYSCGGTAYNFASATQTAPPIGSNMTNAGWADITASDLAGNPTDANPARNPTVGTDIQAPNDVSAMTAVPGAAGSKSIVVTWVNSTDNGPAGVAGRQLAVYNLGTTTPVAGCPPVAVTAATTTRTISCLVSGTHYDVWVYTSDNAGNNSAGAEKLNIRAG